MKKALCWFTLFCLLNLGAQWLARAPDELIRMRYDSKGPTTEQAQKLVNVVAWAQKQGVSAKNEALNATVTADALQVQGPLYLLDDLELLQGLMPVFGSESLCALEERAALKLFGSANIIGQTITVEERIYTIVCVFRIPNAALFDIATPLLIYPADKDTRFQALDFRSTMEDAEKQLNQAGISAPDRILDQNQAIGFLTSLPILLAVLLVFVKLPHPWKIPGLLLMALLVGTSAIVFQSPPVAWLPSRWSDTDFYPTLFKSLLQKKAQSAMLASPRLDVIRQGEGILSLMLSALSLFVLIYFKKEVSQ